MTITPNPGAVAEMYGITFTPDELTLLTASPGLLDPYDRQRAYLLQMALATCQCPGCGYLICQRSAAGMTLFTVPATVRADDDYTCPACKARLTWHLGLFGGQQWFTLNAGQTVTVPERERPSEARWNLPGRGDPR